MKLLLVAMNAWIMLGASIATAIVSLGTMAYQGFAAAGGAVATVAAEEAG
ncbi:MAG: hypothetical protein LBP35_01905 [Candidatus Ancillula trichonymphae]|jgi:hypothetical protein|nr:hypothetical protein [Candidatus Ancillula trichonymphae]